MATPAMTTGLNALANSSRAPVDEEMLLRIIETGDGPGHLVRALFEDCSLETLQRISLAAGIELSTLTKSYAAAKKLHGAANPEFDRLANDPY
jgi:hypothetical protein